MPIEWNKPLSDQIGDYGQIAEIHDADINTLQCFQRMPVTPANQHQRCEQKANVSLIVLADAVRKNQHKAESLDAVINPRDSLELDPEGPLHEGLKCSFQHDKEA